MSEDEGGAKAPGGNKSDKGKKNAAALAAALRANLIRRKVARPASDRRAAREKGEEPGPPK
jgi:hypothetical protein